MYKKLNDIKKLIKKKINGLKTVNPQTDNNKVLKPEVLESVGNLFNELFYIYMEKYNGEEYSLNAKNKKNLTTKS